MSGSNRPSYERLESLQNTADVYFHVEIKMHNMSQALLCLVGCAFQR